MELFIIILFISTLIVNIAGVIVTLIITIEQNKYYKNYMVKIDNEDELLNKQSKNNKKRYIRYKEEK